jgi:hypothetical protein
MNCASCGRGQPYGTNCSVCGKEQPNSDWIVTPEFWNRLPRSFRISFVSLLASVLIAIAIINNVQKWNDQKNSSSATTTISSIATPVTTTTIPYPNWTNLTASRAKKVKFDVEEVIALTIDWGKHQSDQNEQQLLLDTASSVNYFCGAKDPLVGKGPSTELNNGYRDVINDCITLTNHVLSNLTGLGATEGNPWDQLVSDAKTFWADLSKFQKATKAFQR